MVYYILYELFHGLLANVENNVNNYASMKIVRPQLRWV